MFYYIENNGKIIIANKDKQIIEDSLEFYPELAGLPILETDRDITMLDMEYRFSDEVADIQAQKERERLNLLSLTKREVFLALYKAKGITPDLVRASISDPEALIEFDYANGYFRGNPLINELGAQLGYTSDDLDYLFREKELPIKEDNGTSEASDETSNEDETSSNPTGEESEE